MYLDINSETFEPKDFVITNFYGQDVCFAWTENEFVYFPYNDKKPTKTLNVYKAPGIIKDFRSFSERVFILCIPKGIHKLTENLEFAVLSKAGIELGLEFCEVLVPNNEVLVLKDKRLKSNKNLFSISATATSADICVLSLNCDDTDKCFYKTILPDNQNNNNLCLISYEKSLYKISGDIVQIIYSCDYVINRILPVKKSEKIIGALIQTNEKVVIFMYSEKKKLMFDKIFFERNVQRICAIIDTGTTENVLLLIHSDGQKTYYTKKLLNGNSVQETRVEDQFYESFKFYQSKFIIYLNKFKELTQIPLELIKNTYDQSTNDYIKLEPNMLKGLENMIGKICDKSLELKTLREKVEDKEDILKRINLFVTKQHLKYCPKESVKRFLNQIFLISDFDKVLPTNSIVVKMLKNQGKSIYSMKYVKDYNTVVEMPIDTQNLSSKLYTTTDLITYKDTGKIWCLIKNYIQDPVPSKNNKVYLTPENLNFVKYKLVVLENLIQDNTITMDALVNLKNEIRQNLSLDCEIFK